MKLNSIRGPLLLAVFVFSMGYFAGGVYGVFDFLLNATRQAALPLDFGYGGARIFGIPKKAWDLGIRRGDVLLEMDGRPFAGYTDMCEAVSKRKPGDLMPVTIRRASDGSIAHLQIPLEPRVDGSIPVWTWLWKITTQILFPLFCMLTGFWVVLNRYRDLSAWLLLFILLASATLLPTATWTGYWSAAANGWDALLGTMLPGMMMLFAIYFPDRLGIDRKRPWLKWIVLLPQSFCSAVFVWYVFFKQVNMSMFESIVPWLFPLLQVQRVVSMIAISIFFFILGAKSGTATGVDARRRLRLMWVGSAVGLTPSFFLTIYSMATGQDWGRGVPEWALLIVIVALTVFPMTLAYVVVVHRAMEIRGVLRQSMKYALARNGLSVLRGIVVAAAAFFILKLDKSTERGIGQQVAALGLSGLAWFTVRSKFSNQLSGWMDRKFFREAYSSEQVLSDLGGEVRKYADTKPLLETVTTRISGTLHTPRVSVLLANGEEYRSDSASLGSESKVIQLLKNSHKPAVVYFDDPDSWVHGVDVEDRRTLQAMDAQLLLPLAGRERLMGVMALGPKLSEEPYSNTDVQLLESVAAQTGLAIENNQLISKLASEAVQKERMNRELEIAREVQQRLFPQKFPTVGGLDCSGKCRAALVVGGDYFDFLTLPDGKLGVAIGDVSGKGISAALLMASLRSSLRGQTIGGSGALSTLMVNMNELVYEASASNRYATFFYGQYDLTTRRLEFVNAGHNAPVILRGSEVLRLEAGGPVVGLLPKAAYRQDAIDLQPGDIFLGYTDGVSEAMNHAEDEWGEEGMIASAQAHAHLDSATMIDRIIAGADAFADGAEQHDDMTLLVMKLKIPGVN